MIARGVVVFVAFAALGFGSQAIAEDAPAKGSPNAEPAEQQDRVYLGNAPLESRMKRWDPGRERRHDPQKGQLWFGRRPAISLRAAYTRSPGRTCASA
jgi:hypothetical protein